jgi:membrane protease YdiL (CAAX protease family)
VLLVGATLALIGFVMGGLVMALGKAWIPERNNFFARWGFTTVAAVTLIWILTSVLAGTALMEFSDGEPSFTMLLALSSAVMAVPAAMIFRYAKQMDPDGIRCLGFRAAGSFRAAGFGLVSYALLLPALLAAGMLWPFVQEAFGAEPQTQEVMRAFFDLKGSELVLPVLFAVLIQPFLEELLFRSFLQPLLVQNFREFGGVVATSAIFAALHGPAAGPVFVLSLILGGVMQRTQRFSSCYLVHALHNGVTVWAVTQFEGLRDIVDTSGLLFF